MRSYAHVVIIGSGRKFIHVSAPDVVKLQMRSRAKISEGTFASLAKDDDLCFVVRPKHEGGLSTAIFRWRAEVCLGFRFDYDAASSNCETFANAVHGWWAEGHMASFHLVNRLAGLTLFISGSQRTRSATSQRFHKGDKIHQRQ